MMTAEERTRAASDIRAYYGTDMYYAMIRFLSAEAEHALVRLLNATTEKDSDMQRGAALHLQRIVTDLKRQISE